jgi:hypothetical protein
MNGQSRPHKQRTRPSLTVLILSRLDRNQILLTSAASATLVLGVKQFSNDPVGRAEGLSLSDMALGPKYYRRIIRDRYPATSQRTVKTREL